MGLAHLIGHAVTLRGTADNAHQGAAVFRHDEWVVYVEGIAEWGALAGSTLEVTGVLVGNKLAPDPVVEDGAVSHGSPGAHYVLRCASWTIIQRVAESSLKTD